MKDNEVLGGLELRCAETGNVLEQMSIFELIWCKDDSEDFKRRDEQNTILK